MSANPPFLSLCLVILRPCSCVDCKLQGLACCAACQFQVDASCVSAYLFLFDRVGSCSSCPFFGHFSHNLAGEFLQVFPALQVLTPLPGCANLVATFSSLVPIQLWYRLEHLPFFAQCSVRPVMHRIPFSLTRTLKSLLAC